MKLLGEICRKEINELKDLNELKNSYLDLVNAIKSEDKYIRNLFTDELKETLFLDIKSMEMHQDDFYKKLIKKYNWNIENSTKLYFEFEDAKVYAE
jgi:CXXX repeat modification system protein